MKLLRNTLKLIMKCGNKFIMTLLYKKYLYVYFHRFLSCLLNKDLMAKVSSICQILEVLSRTLQVCNSRIPFFSFGLFVQWWAQKRLVF